MTVQLSRARLLMGQGRHADAEKEIRASLAAEPDDAEAFILLAICLAEQEKHKEALDAARQAVARAPDEAESHFALALTHYRGNRNKDAKTSLSEAVRLNPHDERYFGLLAAIHVEGKDWQRAVKAAERGLEIDPDDSACQNFRAIALTSLGNREAAGETIRSALRKEPENATTHANMGWTLLHNGEPKKAMEHFREALRLNPNLEWARAGILEALKAHNFLYRQVLRYFLFMSRKNARVQWFIVIGLFLLVRAASTLGKSNPELQPFVIPIVILYGLFVYLTWTAGPLFDLMLRLHPFGKLALNDTERRASSWVGLCLLCCVLSFLSFPFTAHAISLILGFYFLLLLIPLSGSLRTPPGRARILLLAYTALIGTVSLAGLLASAFLNVPEIVTGVSVGVLAIGVFAFTIIANVLRAA